VWRFAIGSFAIGSFAIGWVPDGGSRTVPNEARPSSDTARPPSRCTRRYPCKPWQRHSDWGTATEICFGNASHGQRTRRSGPRLAPDVRAFAETPSPPRPTRRPLTGGREHGHRSRSRSGPKFERLAVLGCWPRCMSPLSWGFRNPCNWAKPSGMARRPPPTSRRCMTNGPANVRHCLVGRGGDGDTAKARTSGVKRGPDRRVR
jgi:hypothetical protein